MKIFVESTEPDGRLRFIWNAELRKKNDSDSSHNRVCGVITSSSFLDEWTKRHIPPQRQNFKLMTLVYYSSRKMNGPQKATIIAQAPRRFNSVFYSREFPRKPLSICDGWIQLLFMEIRALKFIFQTSSFNPEDHVPPPTSHSRPASQSYRRDIFRG